MQNDQSGALFLALLYILWIPVLVLFYQNRLVHPIKGRSPWLIILVDVVSLVFGLINCGQAFFQNDWPCGINLYGNLFTGSVGIIYLYVYRLLRLLFSYEITKNVMQLENKTGEQILEWKENWYTRNRHLIRPNYIGKAFGVFLFILFLEANIVYGLSPDFITSHGCPPQVNYPLMYAHFILTVAVTCVGFLAIWILGVLLFKHHMDAFSIKAEFRAFFIFCGLSILIWLITTFAGVGEQYLSTYVMIWATHLIFLVSTVWPYFLSIKEKREMTKVCEEVQKKLSSLRNILETPEGFSSFLSYLTTEFSSENLLFWRDVEEYKKLDITDEIAVRARCREIHTKFIREGAPFSVNISDKLAQETRTNVLHLPPTGHLPLEALHVFDKAQTEVYSLMSSDGFSRYQRTEMYKQFVAKLRGPRGSMAEACGLNGSKHGSKHSKHSKGLLANAALGEQLADGKIELALVVKEAVSGNSNIEVQNNNQTRSTFITKKINNSFTTTTTSTTSSTASTINSSTSGGSSGKEEGGRNSTGGNNNNNSSGIYRPVSSSFDEEQYILRHSLRKKSDPTDSPERSKLSNYSDAPLLVRHENGSGEIVYTGGDSNQGSPMHDEHSSHHGGFRLWDSESPRNLLHSNSPSLRASTPTIRPHPIHLSGLIETDQEPSDDLPLPPSAKRLNFPSIPNAHDGDDYTPISSSSQPPSPYMGNLSAPPSPMPLNLSLSLPTSTSHPSLNLSAPPSPNPAPIVLNSLLNPSSSSSTSSDSLSISNIRSTTTGPPPTITGTPTLLSDTGEFYVV